MLRQEYRDLVESIIEQEKKLNLARQMKRDAEAELTKCNGYVEYNEARLKEYQGRLASLESKIFELKP